VNRVQAGIFNVTPPAPGDDDGSYLRWHLLDHMPEQFQLPGIVQAWRWIADGPYLDARLDGERVLPDVGGVVHYLVGDPVEPTLVDFMDLGRDLAAAGRFPVRRPSLHLSALALRRSLASPAALVSAEVLPWRPHRGVFLAIEERGSEIDEDDLDAVVQVPGVAGLWEFVSTDRWSLPERMASGALRTSVVYLDGDPLAVTDALAPLVRKRWASGAGRPLFAGPMRSMIRWEAWP
jgi:hypothetical protein